jgi:prepilin-type processing-associated H-X9-DG protein
LGTFNTGGPVPGYEVKPTLYLLRGDGTVLWCDGHARMSHWPPEKTRAALEEEIEKHFAQTEP